MRGTFFDGVSERAEFGAQLAVFHGVENGSALPGGLYDSGASEQSQMSGDHGEIDGAAVCEFADGARSGAFGQTAKQTQAGGIAEAFEQFGIEQIVDRPATGGGLFGVAGRIYGYLRHYANDNFPGLFIK